MGIQITPGTTLRELVSRDPRLRAVFERFGLDYCCGGGQSLGAAAAKEGVAVGPLISALNDALTAPAPAGAGERNWSQASLTELADHIEKKHHTFMKQQLPRLADILARVRKAHGAHHGAMLTALQGVFQSLRSEIEEHLLKEERILFPLIREMQAYADGKGPAPVCHCGSVENPIRQMEHEHEAAGGALEKMRELTDDYTLPPDACESFAALYEGLQAVGNDLHEHIHLENNILFPGALELEKGAENV